jgi:hypothetical protein
MPKCPPESPPCGPPVRPERHCEPHSGRSHAVASSLGSRMRSYAAAFSWNIQRTRGKPRCLVCAVPATNLMQPFTSSIRLRMTWLIRWPGWRVRLRALDRRGERHEADHLRQRAGLTRGIGRAVVRQPLDRPGQLSHQDKAAFDTLDHQVADSAAVDATQGSNPGDCLTITAVESEGDALAIVAVDLEAVGAPAGVGLIDRDAPVMASCRCRCGGPV